MAPSWGGGVGGGGYGVHCTASPHTAWPVPRPRERPLRCRKGGGGEGTVCFVLVYTCSGMALRRPRATAPLERGSELAAVLPSDVRLGPTDPPGLHVVSGFRDRVWGGRWV